MEGVGGEVGLKTERECCGGVVYREGDASETSVDEAEDGHGESESAEDDDDDGESRAVCGGGWIPAGRCARRGVWGGVGGARTGRWVGVGGEDGNAAWAAAESKAGQYAA